jgi:aminopeptidase N
LKTRIFVLGILSIAVSGLAQEDRRSRIDVESYVIDAQVNPETQTLTARATVRFIPDDQSNTVTFELNNALNISRIVDDKGQSLQSSRNQSDNSVRVSFPDGVRKGQPVALTFSYDGRLTGNEESPIYGIKFAAIQPDYAFLLYPARWFPVSGYTIDRFTAKINVTVPQGYTVVASGIDSKPVSTGDRATFGFDFAKPSFPGDIAVEKGQPVKNSTDGLTTTLWFRGPEANMANTYGAATAQMMGYFTGVFGIAPYANMTVIETADGSPNGYAAPGIVFLSPQTIGKQVNANVLANQLARQWWEIQVSPINRNHLWLENGMALYSEALWTEKEKGAAAMEQRTKDMSISALTVDNVPLIQTSRLEDYSPEYWALSADKGAVVFQMLRSTMGDEKFFAAIKAFLQQYAWKSVATEDFRKSCEAVMGEELRYFFIQWVESNGAPEFKVEWKILRTRSAEGKGGFRVQGKITQDLDTFRMPVDLHIETDGNPEDKRIEVMGTSSEFSVDTFGKPKKITIDPGNKVLRMSPDMRVDVAIRRGQQLVEVSEFAEALKEYQRALDTKKNSSMAHYRVAEVFFLQQSWQSASTEFRDALQGDLNPKWIEVWCHINLGKIFDISGQRERAVNEYTQAQRTRDNTDGAQDEVAKYLREPFKIQSKERI